MRVSERMACRLTGLSRSAYRRTLKADTVADPDAALREWLRGYAKKHPRWGYRRAYHDARDECLNINSFYSLLHAQVVIGDWKVEYNTVRRHSALGYLTPADYARHCTHEMEPDDSHRDRT